MTELIRTIFVFPGRRDNRFRTSAYIATLAAILLLPAAPAAMAAKSDCPSGYFCAWEHKDYQGKMQKTRNYREYVGRTFNDRYSSVWNRTGKVVYMSKHINCDGWDQHIGDRVSVSNLSNWGSNDEVSSVHVGTNYTNHWHC